MELYYDNFCIEFELLTVCYSLDDADQGFPLTHISHTLHLIRYDVPLGVVPLKLLDVEVAIFGVSLLSYPYEADDIGVSLPISSPDFLGNTLFLAASFSCGISDNKYFESERESPAYVFGGILPHFHAASFVIPHYSQTSHDYFETELFKTLSIKPFSNKLWEIEN